MKKFLIVVVGVLAATSAHAQSSPNCILGQPNGWACPPGGPRDDGTRIMIIQDPPRSFIQNEPPPQRPYRPHGGSLIR